MTDLVAREYGIGRGPVIVLHGGPAAAGDVAPLARELGKQWHVFETFQRGSGGKPLTVATHVQDLERSWPGSPRDSTSQLTTLGNHRLQPTAPGAIG